MRAAECGAGHADGLRSGSCYTSIVMRIVSAHQPPTVVHGGVAIALAEALTLPATALLFVPRMALLALLLIGVVPSERDSSATVGVDLKPAAGVTFSLAERVAGRRATLVRQGSELRGPGGPVPPGRPGPVNGVAWQISPSCGLSHNSGVVFWVSGTGQSVECSRRAGSVR